MEAAVYASASGEQPKPAEKVRAVLSRNRLLGAFGHSAVLLSSTRDRERELDPELCAGRSFQVQPTTQLPRQDMHECHAHALALPVIEVGRQPLSIVRKREAVPSPRPCSRVPLPRVPCVRAETRT